ncbi:SMP-30/gluconolactonase/LRE family protein [Rhodobacteraceae bacterium CCMM004]|nr:SMP-30/gluconolactonase/LRE family protein [Rhodobacteraceae bacterium CCMM004]
MTPLLPTSAATVFFDGTFSTPRLAHPEGVAVHADGSVWAGTENGDLVRVAPDGSAVEPLGSTDGFLLGLAFDGAGNCYACDLRHAAIFRYDARSGALDRFASGGIVVPNYPVVDEARGHLYVSDSFDFNRPGGGIYRYDLATGEGGLWTSEEMQFANGMAMAPDGSGLFVVESTAAALSFVPIGPDGAAGPRRRVVGGLDVVPDGVLVLPGGDLIVSMYEPSRLYRWSERSGLELLIEDRQATVLAHPTNVALLPDGHLVTANLGRWHLSKVDLSGLE